MSVTWNNEYDPNPLIKKIVQTRTVDEKGRILFTGPEPFEYIALLFSMLHFSKNIPEIDGRGIVEHVLFNASKPITAKSVLEEVNRLEDEYYKTPITRLMLVTSISIDKKAILPNMKINNSYIVFGGQLPKFCHEERDTIINKRVRSLLFTSVPVDYLPVRIYISARSHNEAVDRGINDLNLIRGIWNWFYNRAYSIRKSFGGKRAPVNKIVQGPLHTLHFPNGKIATNTVWYESRFYFPQIVFNPSPDLKKLNDFTKLVRSKLRQCNYCKVMEDCIIHYAVALDDRDWEAAFLRLWSVLEKLTNTEDSYKETIRRASFIFSDRDYAQQILKHLKNFRNKYVHENVDSSEIEIFMYELKHIIESLLGFHLFNKFGFTSSEDVAKFLDILPDKNHVSSLIKQLNFAQKYLHYI